MKNNKLLKFNIIYFTALTLVAVVFFFGYLGFITNDILSSFLIQILVMFAIPLLMLTIMNNQSLKTTFSNCGFKKINLKMIAISVAIGVVLYLLNSFVSTISISFIYMLGYESLSSQSSTIYTNSNFFQELILTCVLPGFCEEFLHRGVMLFSQSKYKNKKYCLIISSILFGFTHLNIKQFFYTAIMGLFMGYIGIVSQSIYPCMIVHFLNNFLSTYVTFGSHLNWPLIDVYEFAISTIYSNMISFITISAISIVGLIYLYRYLCNQMKTARAKYDVAETLKLLKSQKITHEQAQSNIDIINISLKETISSYNTHYKQSFSEKIPLICSFVLGAFITISSFIWGII